jgi:predicted DNA-binding WGR domain protein
MLPLLYWKSFKPEDNRYRYYTLSISIEQDLWGQPAVVCRWGRLWGRSRERIRWDKTIAELSALVAATHRIRVRHGYSLTKGNLQLFSA